MHPRNVKENQGINFKHLALLVHAILLLIRCNFCSRKPESGKENDDWLVLSVSSFSLISLEFPDTYLEVFSRVCIFVNLSFVFLLFGCNAATLRKRLNPTDVGKRPKFVLRKFWE